ncbi:metallophosphoesterase family protein [Gimesia aquarii]|uniref:3',5'-cyclic adenosine monophosphate phosphodiesterase CpdA n=1 Tax=Gimesia aquarii TaxID=2527964 RepID=A0A517VR61_9PLAN|nr:metallophosphoesterase [Gimesia aquarii]QDT95430.1 3',5'-cyclic adenosine monophosphate phosphodiesterase CpdA [Gimesia aquarii]
MPIHLPTQNRRQFLITLGAGLVASQTGVYASETQQEIVYLLNDTHIGEKHPANSPVPSHLRQVVSELVGLKRKPACVLINGDLALKDGQPGDYRHFAKLIRPLREAKIDTHLTLGNHDQRDVFYEVMKEEQPESPPVKSRHISVVQTRYANFFLLDSLHKTMVTQGTLGKEQRTWLAKALDAHSEKPAIIVTHHNPRLGGNPVHFPGGLTDSVELWKLLVARPQVKAYIHGHIHHRGNAQHQGIHIFNTPATSYVANPDKSTTGWTIARLSPKGITLTTRTNDEEHAWNHQSKTLHWR